MTIILLIITVGISYVSFSDRNLFHKLLFSPFSISTKNEWYRFISHVFVHGDMNHLFVNMLTFYFFAPTIERILEIETGSVLTFYILYFSAAIVSSIYDFVKNRNNPYYSAVGASGAISALLFIFVYFLPFEKIYLMFIIPVPGFVLGPLYIGYSYYMSKKSNDSIGHSAHLYGALYGLLFAFIIDKFLIF